MKYFKKGIAVFIGSLLIAMGINGFLVPFKLLEGGAIGISLIFHYLTGVKVGVTFLLVSIPIFVLALFFYRSFFYNGINGMLFSSFVIDLLYPLHIVGEQLMIPSILAAALGGILIGSGVGIMFCFDITMGGLDLLAQMLARKLSVNPGVIIFCFDIIIVTIGSMLIVSVQLLLSFTTILFAAVNAGVQNMLLTAHALGLGTIWRTGAICYNPTVTKFFNLSEQGEIAAFIYLGYPDMEPKPIQRTDAKELTTWID